MEVYFNINFHRTKDITKKLFKLTFVVPFITQKAEEAKYWSSLLIERSTAAR